MRKLTDIQAIIPFDQRIEDKVAYAVDFFMSNGYFVEPKDIFIKIGGLSGGWDDKATAEVYLCVS